MKQLVKNQSVLLTVDSLGGNGNGVAREKASGMVVFVPQTAAGDTVRAKIIKVTKSYAVGKLETVVSPSADRTEPVCPIFDKCGGCVFQHISYEAECRLKRAMIDDSFSHIGGLSLRTEAFFGAESPYRYRNKAIYPIAEGADGRLHAGFYAKMSHRIVEHTDCAIGAAEFSRCKETVLSLLNDLRLSGYREETGKGLCRGLYLRKNEEGGILLSLIINGRSLGKENERAFIDGIRQKEPQVIGILLNHNTKDGNAVLGDEWTTLWGESVLTDTLLGKTFCLAPAAFYQVNHRQCERLYSIAAEFAGLRGGDTFFDLYCGAGTIGICLSTEGSALVGVEISPDATKNATANAGRNGVNGEFICLDAGEALDSERLRQKKPRVIVLDPPRKGCGDDACRKIASFAAERIVYISCNSQTLARDLAVFSQNGYLPQRAVGVDLFPRTGHVETVVLMSRVKE